MGVSIQKLARNQAVFGSRRKEKANPAVLPHYADPFLFILFYVNSSHSPRLFPLVLNVIPNFRSFATGVWHKLLRADKRATATTPKSPVFKVKRRWGHSSFPAYVYRGPLEWTKARLSSMSCGGQGESHGESHGELPSQSRWEYSGAGVTAMDTDYRIESVGSQYIVVDPWDEINPRAT